MTLLRKTLVAACCILGTTLQAQKLELKWKSDTVLRVPESVLYDANRKILYVANIDGAPDGKDGVGFISKVNPNGKIENLKWATGLDAPKGMGVYKGNLYVADISRVDVIDIASGKVTDKIEIEGSKFLNDITVDKNGKVFISDTGTGKIFTLNGNKAELYFESTEFKGINGLLAEGNDIYIVDFGNGNNYILSADKKLKKIGMSSQGADGVVALTKGAHLVSSWHGEVYYVSASGEAKKLLDTKDKKINAADIEYDARTKMLFVPTFFANSVMAYELKD
jgi:DNA-binding beta-propeller fold protein YncE